MIKKEMIAMLLGRRTGQQAWSTDSKRLQNLQLLLAVNTVLLIFH